ncbi:hypothetical protein [Streptomyces shenzhenensis]|uniref:hypothetical protein n=1 Tax=Streptomyces shenzhenensis TaxID=943815 RepID=UPI0011C3A35A|nr:hypothetical protein [Streptomyces shenzhenensis]
MTYRLLPPTQEPVLHAYEPADLDDMTVTEGLDAVLTDLLDHPITTASNRVFTVMRHIDLLCHLTTRATGEAHFGLVYDHADAAAQAAVEPLSRATAHLGRAAAHYTLTLAPALALLKANTQSTLQQQLGAIHVQSQLSVHFHDALRALTEPHQPSEHTMPVPPPPVSRPAATADPGRLHDLPHDDTT